MDLIERQKVIDADAIKQDDPCVNCKYHDHQWDEMPCDACCPAHSGFEQREDRDELPMTNFEYIKQNITKND